MAVAPSILIMVYHLLHDHATYQELGTDHFDQRDREAIVRKAQRRLERLGYEVTIKKKLA